MYEYVFSWSFMKDKRIECVSMDWIDTHWISIYDAEDNLYHRWVLEPDFTTKNEE